MIEKEIIITDKCIVEWTIPQYGNKHYTAYGTIGVKGLVNGIEVIQRCKTKGDTYGSHTPQYIVFQGQRYIVRQCGTLYNPKIELIKWDKELINGHWVYTDRHC